MRISTRVVLPTAIIAVSALLGLWAVTTLPSRAPVPALQPVAAASAPSADGLERLRYAEPRPAVPDLAFLDADGRMVELADFRGRVVLLNLWATWCAPCVKEMPALDRLEATMGGADFAVVALSLDRGGAELVRPFFEDRRLRALPIYLDPQGAAMSALGLKGLPTSVLIDREGREIARLDGPAEWDGPRALRLIERYARR